MELSSHEAPRKRKMDTTNADARRAVMDIQRLFGDWRADLALFFAKTARPLEAHVRNSILQRCQDIDSELMNARVELLLTLSDAPRSVKAHSRIVDIERALDDVEMTIAKLRGRLLG